MVTTTAIAWALGIVVALAIVKRIARRRFLRKMGYGHGHGRWKRRGIGRSFWLRGLFAKLDTTPGQEREIRAAIEEMQERAIDAKNGLPGARENIARAIRADELDTGALEAFNARFDATGEMIKDAAASALRRIHGVLDAKQRTRLADLIAKGSFGRSGGFGGGGPYRSTEML